MSAPRGHRPASVMQLLIDEGVSPERASELVAPIVEWFDGMSAGLARAMLPGLRRTVLTDPQW